MNDRPAGSGVDEEAPAGRRARVDVLIPVYNAAATIESAMRSMLSQTMTDMRLIVVDDGSTDATPGILARLAAEDPRVDLIRTDNRGIVDALNLALARATADLVARHDADDIAFPERLATQMAFLETAPDCVAVGCNAFHIDGAGRRLGYTTTFKPVVVGNPFYAPSKEPYLMHPFLLARRAALLAAGGYRYVFHAEDTDLYWRLSDVGRLSNVVDVLGEYRVHEQSVTAKSIVNGRVAAVNSQLAAVSERRRRSGSSDLAFDRATLPAYHTAERLSGIVDIASRGLNGEEAIYLRVATAAKLLEIAGYRPFRLTRDDCGTIRHYLESHYDSLTRVNRVWLVFRVILHPRRLLRRPLETLTLAPWRVMHRAVRDLYRHVTRDRAAPAV